MQQHHFVDAHTHVQFSGFDADREAIIDRARAAGVWMVNVGTQKDTSRAAVELAEHYPEGMYAVIGLHPIHHLRTHIPNYNLQRCYDETPELHTLKELSLRRSVKSLGLNLWDEKEKRLVSFSSLKRRRAGDSIT